MRIWRKAPSSNRRMPCDISGAWTMFVLDKSEGSRKRVWGILLTRSAHMFCQSWERKPRRDQIFSRPGRDLTSRNNFWLISKTRLPRLLTSQVASLATRKHLGMRPHPIEIVCGTGLYLMPSDMAFYPGNVKEYNNGIQIAGSDAGIGHNLPKGLQPSQFLRNKTNDDGTSAAIPPEGRQSDRQTVEGNSVRKKKKQPSWPLG